jgi:TetR/AcrR family transcriptional regulator, regulator of autoinduction and epiphytic fitness
VPRTYRSDQRAASASRTRARVLAAATGLFERQGYAATTVRAVAADAGVSVQTVEQVFGSKPRLLKACIDLAIAGDDEPVPMLQRDWAEAARAATTPGELLAVVAGVIGPSQERSAGLVLAVFEGAASDEGLARLADEMTSQRRGTATWIVRELRRTSRLRAPERESVDTLWALMDPAIHVQLVRRLAWSRSRYERWFATSAEHLLVPDRQEKGP